MDEVIIQQLIDRGFRVAYHSTAVTLLVHPDLPGLEMRLRPPPRPPPRGRAPGSPPPPPSPGRRGGAARETRRSNRAATFGVAIEVPVLVE